MTDAPLARFIDRDTIEYLRIYPHPTASACRRSLSEGEGP